MSFGVFGLDTEIIEVYRCAVGMVVAIITLASIFWQGKLKRWQ